MAWLEETGFSASFATLRWGRSGPDMPVADNDVLQRRQPFQPDRSADENDLIEHCRSLIASYKKPKYVREIDVLPRNSTGKVVKVALRERAVAETNGN